MKRRRGGHQGRTNSRQTLLFQPFWGRQMIIDMHVIRICAVFLLFSALAPAQKVKTGYDKSIDFSKFTSYTWAEPSVPPTRPILFSTLAGSIEHYMKTKGFTNVAKDGDLILVAEEWSLD